MKLYELLLSTDTSNHMLAYELRRNWSKSEWYDAFDALIEDMLNDKEATKYMSFGSIVLRREPWFVHTSIKTTSTGKLSAHSYSYYPYLIYNGQELIKLVSISDLRPKSKSNDSFKLLMSRFNKALYEPE